MSTLQQFAPMAAERQDWLAPWRSEAVDRLAAARLPQGSDEDWKYTSLRSISRIQFAPVDPATELPDLPAAPLGVWQLVFVDGRFNAELSALPEVSGFTLTPFANAEQAPGWAKPLLDVMSESPDGAFQLLNTAGVEDGLLLDLARGVQLPEPVQILHLRTAADARRSIATRLLINVGDGASLTLVEACSGAAGGDLINQWSQVQIGVDAHVSWLRAQEEGPAATLVTRTDANLDRNARLELTTLDCGAALARHDVDVQFTAPGAVADVRGAYLATGRRHVDHHHRMEHRAPGCTSREDYRGVVADRARAVYNAKAVVHAAAGGTEARQHNRNLMLSDDCEVDTKPELQIYTDDVVCSHGATVGELDEQALFYLRSRGIDPRTARAVLTEGFLADAFRNVRAEGLEGWLNERLRSRLEGELR